MDPLNENLQKGDLKIVKPEEEWFKYYGKLYLFYVDAYRALEDAYDQLLHPQKRKLMRRMLEHVMLRQIQIKQVPSLLLPNRMPSSTPPRATSFAPTLSTFMRSSILKSAFSPPSRCNCRASSSTNPTSASNTATKWSTSSLKSSKTTRPLRRKS